MNYPRSWSYPGQRDPWQEMDPHPEASKSELKLLGVDVRAGDLIEFNYVRFNTSESYLLRGTFLGQRADGDLIVVEDGRPLAFNRRNFLDIKVLSRPEE